MIAPMLLCLMLLGIWLFFGLIVVAKVSENFVHIRTKPVQEDPELLEVREWIAAKEKDFIEKLKFKN